MNVKQQLVRVTFGATMCAVLACSSQARADWKLGATAESLGPVYGIRVVSVMPGGPAQRSGLESGDVVYAVNGRPVNNLVDLQQALAVSGGRADMLLRDVRSGGMVSVPVFLQWINLPPVLPIVPPVPPANSLAQNQVNTITQILGMPVILTYPDAVENAQATTIQDPFGRPVPVIRYNADFLGYLFREHGQWAAISVLAHEVGHHFNGDTGFWGGSTNSWTREMKADFVSGYVLAKSGASEDQATRALRDQFTLMGSLTHPDTPKRVESLVAGWRRGKFGP